MSTTKLLRQQRDTWTFLAPVAGLGLSAAVDYEFRVDAVTFVSAARLPYRRRRLGIGIPLSDLKRLHTGLLVPFFDKADAFVILRRTGVLADVEPELIRLAREELSILALSQLGFRKRRHNAFPVLSHHAAPQSLDFMIIDARANRWSEQSKSVGNIGDLDLNDSWRAFHQRHFFFALLNSLRGGTKLQKGWREDLRRAAILAGQSQCTSDIPHAFLWNMIVLEMLLVTQGDTYKTALPERARALLGWVTDWQVHRFEKRIGEVYSKRCALVHNGHLDSITAKDLLFTDDLVFNLFSNLVRHPSIFPSKAAVVEFAKKVEAEHLLGVRPRVRPRTLNFLSRKYTAQDLAEV